MSVNKSNLQAAAALLILFGASVFVIGLYHLWRSVRALPTPQTITCQELEDQGVPDHTYVRLTNFIYPGDLFYMEDDLVGWTQVWIPVVPEDTPNTRHYRVFVVAKHINNGSELAELKYQGDLQGVITLPRNLDADARRQIGHYLPQSNLDGAYFLEISPNPWPIWKSLGLVAISLLLMLAGFGLYRKVSGPG